MNSGKGIVIYTADETLLMGPLGHIHPYFRGVLGILGGKFRVDLLQGVQVNFSAIGIMKKELVVGVVQQLNQAPAVGFSLAYLA